MVLEDADNWYADDDDLSRQLCEFVETKKGKTDDDDVGECCACDEAKYQVSDCAIPETVRNKDII
jgi:hypothetical protein